ncbi:MAG: hypothetical protein ACREUG_11565, partial [Steroidobacteraceae bacterium]
SEARQVRALVRPPAPLRLIEATQEEQRAHEAFLDLLAKKSGQCLWRALDAEALATATPAAAGGSAAATPAVRA